MNENRDSRNKFLSGSNKIFPSFLWAMILVSAIFLRFYNLENRPMHTDEAVHGEKFIRLFEEGVYRYDPAEYHGPTLNYFTFIPALIQGKNQSGIPNEQTLRSVPAAASVLLLLLLPFFFRKKERTLTVITLFLFSFSPILLFYSRYYIQETLLVTFTFSAIVFFRRNISEQNAGDAVLAGIFTGLAFASKETSIIAFFSGAAAFGIISFSRKNIKPKRRLSPLNIAVFFGAFAFIAGLFYSSFGANPEGMIDIFSSYFHYLKKAGFSTEHIHPWFYYLKLLFIPGEIFFTEIPLLIFMIFGSRITIKEPDKKKLKFIFYFSLIQLLIYSAIPYKTPWLAINFWPGFLLIAAYGAARLWNSHFPKKLTVFIRFIIVIIFLFEIYQTVIINFKYPWQRENPFTYSQPTPSVIKAAGVIEDAVISRFGKSERQAAVVMRHNDYWPLPWYLRNLPNIGWYDEVPDSIYKFPLIISEENLEQIIIKKLYAIPSPGEKYLYVPLFRRRYFLRPGKEIKGYVRLK